MTSSSRKQMFASNFVPRPEPIVVATDTPTTPYAPKLPRPVIKCEPNQLYPELQSLLGLNPFMW